MSKKSLVIILNDEYRDAIEELKRKVKKIPNVSLSSIVRKLLACLNEKLTDEYVEELSQKTILDIVINDIDFTFRELVIKVHFGSQNKESSEVSKKKDLTDFLTEAMLNVWAEKFIRIQNLYQDNPLKLSDEIKKLIREIKRAGINKPIVQQFIDYLREFISQNVSQNLYT